VYMSLHQGQPGPSPGPGLGQQYGQQGYCSSFDCQQGGSSCSTPRNQQQQQQQLPPKGAPLMQSTLTPQGSRQTEYYSPRAPPQEQQQGLWQY
jgi:hypothetical protein